MGLRFCQVMSQSERICMVKRGEGKHLLIANVEDLLDRSPHQGPRNTVRFRNATLTIHARKSLCYQNL